jgi:hypothetical protein
VVSFRPLLTHYEHGSRTVATPLTPLSSSCDQLSGVKRLAPIGCPWHRSILRAGSVNGTSHSSLLTCVANFHGYLKASTSILFRLHLGEHGWPISSRKDVRCGPLTVQQLIWVSVRRGWKRPLIHQRTAGQTHLGILGLRRASIPYYPSRALTIKV